MGLGEVRSLKIDGANSPGYMRASASGSAAVLVTMPFSLLRHSRYPCEVD